MVDRKINAMHKQFGLCWGKYCRECDHFISGEWRGKQYHKCKLYGMSHSEATDWRLSWMACGMFNVPVDIDRINPVYKTLSNKREPEPQLEGQMDISAFLNERTV